MQARPCVIFVGPRIMFGDMITVYKCIAMDSISNEGAQQCKVYPRDELVACGCGVVKIYKRHSENKNLVLGSLPRFILDHTHGTEVSLLTMHYATPRYRGLKRVACVDDQLVQAVSCLMISGECDGASMPWKLA